MKTSLEKCLGHPIILPMGTSKPQFPFININKTSITVIPWFHTWRIIPPECLIFQWIILRFLWKTTMVSNQIPSRMILPVPCDPCDPCAGRHQHEASLVVSSSPGKNMVNWELRITTTTSIIIIIIIIPKNRMDITLSVQTTRQNQRNDTHKSSSGSFCGDAAEIHGPHLCSRILAPGLHILRSVGPPFSINKLVQIITPMSLWFMIRK